MNLTILIIIKTLQTYAAYWFISSQFPARKGCTLLRQVLILSLSLLSQLGEYAVFLQLPAAQLIRTLIRSTVLLFDLLGLYLLSKTLYSRYIMTYFIATKLFPSFYFILSSLQGYTTAVIPEQEIPIDLLCLLLGVEALLFLKRSINSRPQPVQSPQLLHFYGVFVLICLVYSALAVFWEIMTEITAKQQQTAILFISSIISFVSLLFGLGFWLYSRSVKNRLKTESARWEQDLEQNRLKTQTQEEEIKRQRHDQINLTNTIAYLIHNRENQEAVHLISHLASAGDQKEE